MKVLIAVPNSDGMIHKLVMFSVLSMLGDKRVQSTFIAPTHVPSENNRNLIIVDMLKGGYDYLISIDYDNPPRKNVIDLVQYELPLIGCPTPVFANMKKGDFPVYWNALDCVEDGYKPITDQKRMKGLQEVGCIGTGCYIVSREVLEALKDEKPFERTVDQQGRVIKGSDYYFCDKVRSKGFKIYAHYGYPCEHMVNLPLIETMNAFGDYYNHG